MVAISDIEKLAPDLLGKSVAQLEREITERQMAIEKVRAKEEAEKREKLLGEAGHKFDQLMDILRWQEQNGFLPPALKEALTDSGGSFAPHKKMKRPRA